MSGFVEQLSKTRRFQGRVSVSELNASIEQLQQLDKQSEKSKKQGCLWMGLTIPATFLLVVGATALDLPVAVIPIVMVGTGTLIWGGITAFKASKTDFEDRRYELLAQMANRLKIDMASDALFDVQLDLEAVNAKRKFVRKGVAGTWKVKFYEDTWLTLGGQFVDGTRFSISMIEKHQDRHKTKRSRSGKMKSKSKTKASSLAVVSLKPKEKRYPHAGALGAQARGAVQLPRLAQLKDLSASENVLTLKAVTQLTWTAHDGTTLLSKMLLSLYQVLNLSRRIDKKQP
jgi:hypothetical protein